MINPLGFAFENFDAVGRFRAEEKGKPIDASGAYRDGSGKVVQFSGVRDLAEFLAQNEETHRSFAVQLFHYLAKQPIDAFGPDRPEELRRYFAEHDFHVRRLVVEIVSSTAVSQTRKEQ
jgi:hypothetical protein